MNQPSKLELVVHSSETSLLNAVGAVADGDKAEKLFHGNQTLPMVIALRTMVLAELKAAMLAS